MQFRLSACVAALGFIMCAQSAPEVGNAAPAARPGMVWQGEVGGTVFLYLKGKRLKVENKEGAPVAQQNYRFEQRLPDMRQDVRLHVTSGRGYVHIVEQPSLENGFTAAVAILLRGRYAWRNRQFERAAREST